MREWPRRLLPSLLILSLLSSFLSQLLPSGLGHEPSSSLVRNDGPQYLNIGVILDLRSLVGKTTITSIHVAISDFYTKFPGSRARLVLHTRDSKGDVVAAVSAAVDLLQTERVHAIIGPQTGAEAAFVARLATRARIPVLSFSAAAPPGAAPFFVRTDPRPAAQAGPIAALLAGLRWPQAVLIHEDSADFSSLAASLPSALAAAGAAVSRRSPIPASASDGRISGDLLALKVSPIRVFIVHASLPLASRLFSSAKSAGMMAEGYAWIVTAEIVGLLGAMDPDLTQGVVGVEPYFARSERVQEFKRRWKSEFLTRNPGSGVVAPSEYDFWAYDTVWAVAMAAAGATPADPRFDSPANGSNVLEAAGTSNTGPALLDAISKMEFEGIGGGRFRITGGELEAPALGFELVNAVGKQGRVIGRWTAANGLSLPPLAAAVWPGGSRAAPRGWEIPAGGGRLRIAVPAAVAPGFASFLEIQREGNGTAAAVKKASGYVIDVFEAAVRELPYSLPYEFVPFVRPDGSSAGSYDDLVYQVYLQNYDAVVGDMTITSNRSPYVDFTQPYTVSGVSMVVPVLGQEDNTWIFLKPWTAHLWLASGFFFVLTGLVVWILEHRINRDFRGPPAHEFGAVFYFSLSTLVFAHSSENVVSNLGRVVVIIWVFVVLILTSSYTASLTSMLTAQQFQPAVVDINDLIKNGDYVGYLEDSFVKGLLLRLGFNKSKLRPYRSPQQYAGALAKGSHNGGVSAIVDEIPYLQVFLKDYCGNYTMAGQTYKTGGFGFVFPKGSPLAPEFSRAILNLTEGDEMMKIEKRWFGDQATCSNKGAATSSNSLGFSCFWGLFLVTGTASILSLCVSLVSFLYKERTVLNRMKFERSFWRRLTMIAKHFDQIDLSFHTFRRNEGRDGSVEGFRGRPATSSANDFESPTSISGHAHEEGSSHRPTSHAGIVESQC